MEALTNCIVYVSNVVHITGLGLQTFLLVVMVFLMVVMVLDWAVLVFTCCGLEKFLILNPKKSKDQALKNILLVAVT